MIEAQQHHPPDALGIEDSIEVPEHGVEREVIHVALGLSRSAPVVLDEADLLAEPGEGPLQDGDPPSAAVLLNGIPGMSTTTGPPVRPEAVYPIATPSLVFARRRSGGIGVGQRSARKRRGAARIAADTPPLAGGLEAVDGSGDVLLGPVLPELPFADHAVEEDLDPDDRPQLPLDVSARRVVDGPGLAGMRLVRVGEAAHVRFEPFTSSWMTSRPYACTIT